MVNRKSTPKRKKAPSKQVTKIFKLHNKNYKINVTTLREIKRLQSTTSNLIPRLPFARVIREILMEHTTSDHRVQLEALQALQEAAELYLVQLFEDANRCAYHAKRVTVKPNDMNLVLEIRGILDPGYS
nr:histone H3.3-like [Leptinotarsa decemlineata]